MFKFIIVLNFLVFLVTWQEVSGDVSSCFACAGSQSLCVKNNRTDFLKMDCNSFQVEGQSLIYRTSEPLLLESFDNEVGPRTDDDDIGCITVTFTNGSATPENRALKSCIPLEVNNEDVCDYMEVLISRLGGKQTYCHVCISDDCNSTISIYGTQSLIIATCITFLVKLL